MANAASTLLRAVGREQLLRQAVRAAAKAPKTPNEAHASRAVLRHAQLQSVANWMRSQLQGRLDQLDGELESEATAKPLTKGRLPSLLASIDKRVANVLTSMRAQVEAWMEELALAVADKTKAGLEEHHGRKGGDVDANGLLDTPVLGATLEEHFEKLAQDAAFRFGAAACQAVAYGDTGEQLVERFRGQRKVLASEAVHAAAEVVTSLMDALVSSLGRVLDAAIVAYANEGAFRGGDALEGDDRANMGWSWVSQLDDAVCPECEFYSGNRWNVDFEPVDDAPEYPGEPPGSTHWGCRCAIIPVDLSEEPAPEKNFDGWLAQYSRKEQVAAFGEANLRAYQRGDITANQLVGQKDNLMTLQEFKKAD